jgi:hypothetical protein
MRQLRFCGQSISRGRNDFRMVGYSYLIKLVACHPRIVSRCAAEWRQGDFDE